MTQQPFYPAGQQQPFPGQPAVYTQPAQPQYPTYPQAPQQQQQQQFMPGVQAPPAVPQQPLANGSLDDFYSQPGAGTGPSLSWKDKPIGTTYAGIVARDVTNGDVQQQTDPSTGAPKFFKDGRPMFVMKIPLKVAPSEEFPQGEATYYVRGQARDELVRAMAEAGCKGAPQGGAALQVTLVQRRPSRLGNPANVVQIQYRPPAGQAQVSDAASPAPEAAAPSQGQPAQQAASPALAQPVQPVPPAPQAAAPQAAAPQVAAPQPPEGLSPEQQQLLADLTNKQG